MRHVRNFLTRLAILLIALFVFAGCEGMFAPEPVITKFEHSDYSHGTIHDVESSDQLTFTVEGEMPGGSGTIKVIADKDGDKTVLKEEDITKEKVETSLYVSFDSLEEEGTYKVFARAKTAEGKTVDSGKITFDVSIPTATGLFVRGYDVAEIGETFELFTRTMPIGSPSEDVTYSSSDSSIVSVSSDGKELTAEEGGIATITATTVDTGYEGTGKVYVEPSDADGDSTNPWVWDVYGTYTDTTQSVTVGSSDMYYLVPINDSLLMGFEGQADSTIEYEVREGQQWFSVEPQESGEVEESADNEAIASDCDAGFYMLRIKRIDDTASMDVELSIFSN